MAVREKQLTLVSLVVVIDPGTPDFVAPRIDVAQLESDIGTPLRLSQVVTERGAGSLLRVMRYSTEIILQEDRIEVKYEGGAPDFSNIPIETILTKIVRHFPSNSIRTMGYNFAYLIDAGELAVKIIGEMAFLKQEAEKMLGYQLVGASSGLWLQMDNSTLWLRVEPKGNDPKTKWISVNANFSESLQAGIPDAGIIRENLGRRRKTLQELLEKAGIW